jgi:hypothetical protein
MSPISTALAKRQKRSEGIDNKFAPTKSKILADNQAYNDAHKGKDGRYEKGFVPRVLDRKTEKQMRGTFAKQYDTEKKADSYNARQESLASKTQSKHSLALLDQMKNA